MARRDRYDRRPEDKFVEAAFSLVEYVQLHKTVVAVGLVAVAGACLSGLAYRQHVATYNNNADAAFGTAKTAADFRNIVSSYPGSAVEPLALFYEGRALMEGNDYAGAAAAFATFMRLYPDHYLAASALAFTGMIAEQEKRFEDAARAYGSFMERYPKSFLAPMVLMRTGSCDEARGKMAEARAAYERLEREYADNSWKSEARERVAKFGGAGGRKAAAEESRGAGAKTPVAEGGLKKNAKTAAAEAKAPKAKGAGAGEIAPASKP